MIYENPIINKDFSDPDVIRVGKDFYMVSSSFNYVPGVPILHSTDLINWEIINYVLKELPKEFDEVLHGKGAWAPALRYHNDTFFCFIPFPDTGIYVASSKDIYGFFNLTLLNPIKGMIDPCPIWVANKAYVVCAFAKSRIGFNSVIGIFEMSTDCKKVLSDYQIVFDGNNTQPVIEGPKIYYMNNYFYILAPAGSVESGWQTCLRSRNIYGPYEEKIVMISADTQINGPHQGALIELENHEFWFVHFQAKGVYGRVVHLQPVNFINDWPIIGEQTNSTGKPVLRFQAPNLNKMKIKEESPYFYDGLSLDWQFPANNLNYYKINKDLILYAVLPRAKMGDQPNILTKMVEYENFECITFLEPDFQTIKNQCGIIITGNEYAYLLLNGKNEILGFKGNQIDKDKQIFKAKINTNKCYFKIIWHNGLCDFLFSVDDQNYYVGIKGFKASKGMWVGSRLGLFCVGENPSKCIIKFFKVRRLLS